MSEHIKRAELLFSQHRYKLAAAELLKALQEDSFDGYAHSRLALCLLELKNLNEAYSEAKLAISVAPDTPYPHYALAFILSRDERQNEAESAVEAAIALNPWTAYYFSLLARIRILRGNWSGALLAAEHGLALDPNDAACASHRSNALMHMGRNDEAVSSARTTLRQRPDNADSHSTLGWALLYSNDYLGAEQHFREALRLEPHQKWARSGMLKALKSKNAAYRIVLNYFHWRAKLGSYQRIAIFVVLGGIISATSSAFKPVCFIAITLYAVFFVSVWAADPIGNLVLVFDPFGKFLLSKNQIFTARCAGVVILVLVICAVVGIVRHQAGWIVIAALPLVLGFFMSKMYSETNIGGRIFFGVLNVLLLVAGLAGAIDAGL